MIQHLDLIFKIITSNPFSMDIISYYQQFVSQTITDRTQLRHKVAKKITMLGNEYFLKKKITFANHPPDQHEKILFFYLFYVYLNYNDAFNSHIQNQLNHTEALPLPIYSKCIAELIRFGIDAQEATHYFSLFFQLRRAYYFIDHYIKGSSNVISTLRSQIWNCIFTNDLTLFSRHLYKQMEDFSVLFCAPTGTGKSLSAKVIAYASYIPFNPTKMTFSNAFPQLFKQINLTEYAETLLESQLFGHIKGAYTDAYDDQVGLLGDTSSSHTIFLDEVGETPLHIQIKLLRVLQDRTFYPLGSQKAIQFHGRLVGATNKTTHELYQPDIFRPDFFYRLSSVLIHIPPLKDQLAQQPSDIHLYVQHILQHTLSIPSQSLQEFCLNFINTQLINHDWPGNIRELEQCIRRLILTGDYQYNTQDPIAITQELSAQTMLEQYAQSLYDIHRSYSKVAQIMQLDRRTIKKYISHST